MELIEVARSILLIIMALVWTVVGLIILLKMTSNKTNLNSTLNPFRQVVSRYTTGQFKPESDLGQSSGLTQDDIDWALENDATSDEDILDLVSKHKNEVGR